MAAIPGITSYPYRHAAKIVWASVTENDTFTASQIGQNYPDRGVTVQGTFGSATVLVKGSYDGTNYFTLHGQSGALSFTAAGSDIIVENTPYLQCTHSGGTSESVTVTFHGSSYR